MILENFEEKMVRDKNFEFKISNLKFRILFYNVLFIYSLIIFTACNKNSSGDSSTGKPVKFQQYYIQGQQLYIQHCSNCHQENGAGLGLVYPPLAKSDYMENNLEEVICLIRTGRKGEIVVNGKIFVQGMPGIPELTDLEIAEITTYIYNTWEHKHGLIDVTEVSKTLRTCKVYKGHL